jgi:alkylhydroperoxidase family enzyme
METLYERYGALLELVRRLIGVVPKCDPYLEIWPLAFRTYNVMVPNFLNLPMSLWGVGAPKDVLGLAMYASSRVAECAYCSAHTCSFALRRGATVDAVARALEPEAPRSDAERAVLAVARGLASVPCSMQASDRRELLRHFSAAHAEWIAMSIAMMGFLNKWMDAIGVPLEAETLDEVGRVMAPSGWTPGKHGGDLATASGAAPAPDSLRTKISVVPYFPRAIALDRAWTAGVPARWPAVGEYLRERTGHDFPVLGRLRHGRAVRAIATMLKDNLDPAPSVVGIATKCLAGVVYATVTENAPLAAQVRVVARHHGVSDTRLDEAARFANGEDAPSLDAATRSAVLLARATSPSPAAVDDAVVEACRELAPAGIVEIVTWLSVAQMLARVEGWTLFT